MLQFSRLLVLRNNITSKNASRRLDSTPYSWLSILLKPTALTPSNPSPDPLKKSDPSSDSPRKFDPSPDPPKKSDPSSDSPIKPQSKEKVSDSKLSAPWLMFHAKDVKPDKTKFHMFHNRCFVNINTKKPILKKLETSDSGHELPKDIKCIGSSHGWLAFVNPSDCSLYLANPSAPETIKLPSIETLPEFRLTCYKRSDDGLYKIAGFVCRDEDNKESIRSPKYLSENFLGKVVLSSSPKSEDCIVVLATHGQHSKLAFCKISDDKWTNLESNCCCFGDVIYSSHDKKVYAISNCADLEIEAWDLSDPKSPRKTSYLPPICVPEGIRLRANCFSHMYLVESICKILVVAKFSGWYVADDGRVMTPEDDESGQLPYKTLAFSMLKFDPETEKFEELKRLGDRAVFLGINHSFCVSATEFSGVEANTIYYSDDYQGQRGHLISTNRGLCDAQNDYPYGRHDVGLYNLKDKSIKTHYLLRSLNYSVSPVFMGCP